MPYNNRIVGMSKRAKGPSLLKSIPKNRLDVSPDAPPQSDSDSDDDSRVQRADIATTTFMSGSTDDDDFKTSVRATRGNANGRPTRASARQGAIEAEASPERKRLSDDSDHRSSTSQAFKRPRTSDTAQNGLGKHYEDTPESLWAREDAAPRHRKSTYSKSGVFRAYGRQAVSEKSSNAPKDDFSPPRTGFQQPELISDDDTTPSPRKKPVKVQQVSDDVTTPSPAKAMKKVPRRALSRDLKRSPRKRFRGVDTDMVQDDRPDEESQRPVFKVPDTSGSTVAPEKDNGFLRSTSVIDLERSMSPLTDLDSPTADDGPVCPFCGESVDGSLLGDFTAQNKRMDVRKQEQFCRLHQQKSAQNTWDAKGYPSVDWSGLESRIAKRYGLLKDIVKSGKSHYGNVFDERLKTGKAKTLTGLYESEGNLIPGYYGVRGLRVMSDNLVKQFSSLMQERARQNKLISARGYTAYVHAVLVPELTVQLIMEDMRVDQDTARSILRESVVVGELLNDEVPDVLYEDSDHSDAESLSSLSELSASESE